jgi:large subunit ribosomal protein L5
MERLKEKFNTKVIPQLKEELGVDNVFALPVIKKVTINAGLSAKKEPKFIEVLLETLEKISGQKPVATKARKSIAGFKIREGLVIGAMVTLRGKRMWDFIEKLVHVTFPRVRDFRGIPLTAIDRSGNFNYGFKEHLAFSEISPDAVDTIHGLQVNITTTATTREEGLALFKALGFPFKKSGK